MPAAMGAGGDRERRSFSLFTYRIISLSSQLGEGRKQFNVLAEVKGQEVSDGGMV